MKSLHSINKSLVSVSLFFSLACFANEVNIDNLLTNIEKKTDLSSKTKLENGGISYIYTREDIQKMQAHKLEDILKATYPLGYDENNFGIADPYYVGSSAPFMSSEIRIYIDNQEISTGLYGSGLVVYGKMDIDFVDHIEVYIGNPTFELSTEPASTIIKLYSKVAQKDDGSKVSIAGGSYGSKEIVGYTTATLDNDWSYFAYASAVDNERKKYYNHGAELSRDGDDIHALGTFSKGNQHLLVDALHMEDDSFISASLFATPKTSTLENDYLHIGYDAVLGNFSVLLTFDMLNTQTSFEDLYAQKIQYLNTTYDTNIPYAFNTDSESEVYTAGVNYNLQVAAHKIVMGAKYRLKHFTYSNLDMNGEQLPRTGHTQQAIATLFLEDQYSIANNKIVTLGASYSMVRNNHSDQDDDLFGYRLGYTYTNNHLISKTVTSYMEISLDPYLVHSIYLADPQKRVAKEKETIYIQNLKYKNKSNAYELIANYVVMKNRLVPDESGLLDTYDKDIKICGALVRYTKRYRMYDKLEIAIAANRLKNLRKVKDLREYSGYARNFNTIGKFDIFNEILYYRDNFEYTNYYDYSAGIIYHSSEDLSFSLKGTNLLSHSKEDHYFRLNPDTLQAEEPLKIAPIDKKIMLRMEYTF